MDNGSRPTRVMIADEQAIFRHGLRRLLEADTAIRVVGEAPDGPAAVKLARQLRPNVLLLNLALPQRSELEGPNGLMSCGSSVRMVVMATSISRTQVLEALQLGAHGVVLKTASPRVFVNSIRAVTDGHYWLESEGVAILVEVLREGFSNGNGTKSPKDYGLTQRELEIIANIATGRSNKEVGQGFSISERTVKHHLTNIFLKVGVSNRLELALFAFNHGLISNPPPCSAQPLR